MRGYLTSYVELFHDRPSGAPRIDSVEIPLIQRDYAQGRPGTFVEEIRANFLESLLGAIADEEPLGLDFVYGKVESGIFHPVDGQQRLTTMFLLHWYLASAAQCLDADATWTSFSYATRPSARLFCERLVTNALPQDVDRPSAWIRDQAWYLHVWKHDPTIQAMLVMIDAIQEAVRRLHPDLDVQAAWRRLTDEASPAVSFYLLPLEDMDSEDLYIKMNSRGKPLTPFENFKARFEQDIGHSDRVNEFAHKIDGAWSDLLWPFHGGDNIVDDEFIRYIDYITEICEFREGKSLEPGRLGPRARIIFGADSPRAQEHLDFLFDAFDLWAANGSVQSAFDRYLSVTQLGGTDVDRDKVQLFGATSTNLFEQCCHQFDSQTRRNRTFTLQQSLLLYAVLLHNIHDTENFVHRMRVLRNLIAASDDEMRHANMPGLLKDTEEIIVTGELATVDKFGRNQLEDERLKADFLESNPDLAETVSRLEDHPILRGTLSSFEFEPATFRQRADAFETAFGDPTKWQQLTGALLATGDYQRRRPWGPGWQFGTSSVDHQRVWRLLLTNAPRETLSSTRAVLAKFLDGLTDSATPVDQHLEDVMTAWLSTHDESNHFDWRYYLIKYPSMREGATGIYFGEDGELGYSMCMLRATQLNSWYRDPILLELWRPSDVSDMVEDPWFTGYDTTPRWLRLIRSGVGIRSVAQGFRLQRPTDASRGTVFDAICEQHNIMAEDDVLLFKAPQADRDGELVDSADRVVLGSAFLKKLVEFGL